MDVSEKEGRTVCSGLQEEFTKKDVMFLQADVSLKEDLVRYTIPVATPLLGVWPMRLAASAVEMEGPGSSPIFHCQCGFLVAQRSCVVPLRIEE